MSKDEIELVITIILLERELGHHLSLRDDLSSLDDSQLGQLPKVIPWQFNEVRQA
jgi:hypothetical protein